MFRVVKVNTMSCFIFIVISLRIEKKSSAVAEIGDRGMGRKERGGAVVPV